MGVPGGLGHAQHGPKQLPLFQGSAGSSRSQKASRSEQHQRQQAMAVRQPMAAKAVLYQRAPIPPFDYIHHYYTPEQAQTFVETVYFPGESPLSGREVLNFLLTPRSLNVRELPNIGALSAYDFQQLGQPEKDLRAFVESKGIRYADFLETAMRDARRQGLVYQLKDFRQGGAAYYGIPQHVRQQSDVLGLTPPAKEGSTSQAVEGRSAPAKASGFSKALGRVLEAVADVEEHNPLREELFDYTAQLMRSAMAAELIPKEAIPPAFEQARTDTLSQPGALEPALLTLYEFVLGNETPVTASVKALCQEAEQAGHISGQALDEVRALVQEAFT